MAPNKDDVLSLALAVGLPLLGGQIGGIVTLPDVKPGGWYDKIKKPRWTPPKWAFPVVWPLLYVGQGVASWLVYKTKGTKKRLPLALYGAQLLLNLAWQPIFFKAHRPDIALADSAAMLGTAAAATVAMTRVAGDHKAAVAGLMTPYVAWVAFATALTYNIWQNNPDAAKIGTKEGATTKGSGKVEGGTPAGQKGVFGAMEKAVGSK
mmetsp:Transcript_9752/g.24274  ORF Transcript_9752/g.24274 Transcript_9752/m.24274 type:complete len:207 (+) Transcript_9752:55-675(+)|eukprot:CAMPEP_0202858088 /NCGR_PEP_ID=MMETSP1391-20130828/761_1 /ASSEMBLY_ACC=CAM_ASM_000867 /TAXON_ID=1034604 /ORGANISM="Chlamydomonas leiostraca, Strain SAG 11-49" /LENGTH=206 /DNA_ID=CAMNT_0049536961 /DNA_START=55 /DNA_END=675 /DNA_ORIENTATION=+